MRITQVLLVLAVSTFLGSLQAAEAQTGTVEGVVLLDGAQPPFSVLVDVYGPIVAFPYYFHIVTSTDGNGHYELQSVPAGVSATVWVGYMPVGYRVASPVGGEAAVTLSTGETATVNFTLEAAGAGPARGLGYWKHQVNVCCGGHGNAQESYDDLDRYTRLMSDRLPEIPGVSPCDVGLLWYQLNWPGGACSYPDFQRHCTALYLNVASGRLLCGQVISDDGATVSQAIQNIEQGFGGNNCESLRLSTDVAEAMNEGRMIPAGVIDLTRPTIYYTHALPSAPVVDQIRVTPNPVVKSSTLDFEVATAGQVEVRVFDIAGRAVRTVLDGELPSGRHMVVWDGRSDGDEAVANGVYFYRVEMAGEDPLIARFVMMR